MKRTWLSILVVVGTIVLLTLFLGLQYKWLTKASEAERERMQKRVEADTARFAEDFNREIQSAYYNFQTRSSLWRDSAWPEFNERYAFWKERTAYPELIREIYFVPKDTEVAPLRYDPAKQIFELVPVDDRLRKLRTDVADDETFRNFYENDYALMVPVFEDEKEVDHVILRRSSGPKPGVRHMPEKFGWVVVLLDEKVIRENILPDLTTKYFAEGDFAVSVFDGSGEQVYASRDAATGWDATTTLFNLEPDNFVFFTNRDVLRRMPDAPRKVVEGANKGLGVDRRVESRTFTRTETLATRSGSFRLELKEPHERHNVSMVTSTEPTGAWVLRTQHTAGSVAAFILAERSKSFLIGLGIYALLVGAIVAILLSALRSKRFAQRQIDFVSSVSHEFRTPLAVIYSAGENLADGIAKEDGQVSRYGDLIKGEGKKLSGMVEQILEFAGANSGKQKYNLAPVDVVEIVRDAIGECMPLIDSGRFEIETDLQSDLPKIRADRGALSSALQNLIANSVKYSNGSKWIKVSAVNGGNSVKISVEDRGIGIRDADLRRVFEPFYRAKEVVDAQISGNGLGLNLVKKIAEAHGGKVRVESDPGQGSKFTIELPQR